MRGNSTLCSLPVLDLQLSCSLPGASEAKESPFHVIRTFSMGNISTSSSFSISKRKLSKNNLEQNYQQVDMCTNAINTSSVFFQMVVNFLLSLNRPHQYIKSHFIFANEHIISTGNPCIQKINQWHSIISRIIKAIVKQCFSFSLGFCLSCTSLIF